jgi:GNAT superfamily N-acetyltransferase
MQSSEEESINNSKILISEDLLLSEKKQIFKLWNSEFPICIGFKELAELENYFKSIEVIRHHKLVEKNKIIAWAVTFRREDKINFSIIVNRQHQGQGHGKKLIQRLQELNNELNGWIIIDESYLRKDESIYPIKLNFYQKMGFILTGKEWETKKIKTTQINWISKQ